MSEINQREKTGDLSSAQAESARALLPGLAEAQASGSALNRATAAQRLAAALKESATTPGTVRALDTESNLREAQTTEISTLTPAKYQSIISGAKLNDAQALEIATASPARLAQIQSQTGLNDAQVAEIKRLGPDKLKELQANTARINAEATKLTTLTEPEKAHVQAQTSAIATTADKARYELELEKKLQKVTIDTKEALLLKAQNENATYVDLKLPDGSVGKITTDKLADIIRNERADERLLRTHQDQIAHQKVTQANHVQKTELDRAKIASDAEAVILGTDAKGNENKYKPAVQGEIDQFNANSTGTHIYSFQNTKDHWYQFKGESNLGVSKTAIPKVRLADGTIVQRNARYITEQATLINLTPKEYIDKIPPTMLVK